MARWQVVLIVLAFLGMAAAILATADSQRREIEARATWTATRGTVLEVRPIPLFHGRGTGVVGRHVVAGKA